MRGWADKWVWMVLAVRCCCVSWCSCLWWSYLLISKAIPGTLLLWKAEQLKRKMRLKLPVLWKCNHCEFSARNCLWAKTEPELGICSCPLHWHKALCASPEGCHPTGTCPFRNLLAGQRGGFDITAACMGRTSRKILFFWPGKPGCLPAVFHE